MDRVKFLKDDTYSFLRSFDTDLAIKIFGLLEILDELGTRLGPPKLKKITKDIYELRIIFSVSVFQWSLLKGGKHEIAFFCNLSTIIWYIL